MKNFIISLVIIFISLVAAIVIIPLVFQDDIRVEVDKVITKNFNADIVFDTNDFSISLLKNFPNATAAINNFKVLNRAPFNGQTLIAAKGFEAEIDLFSLFGDKLQVNGLKLDSPDINILILKDGTANYNIGNTVEQESKPVTSPDGSANLNIGINHWEVVNANVVFDDVSVPLRLEMNNLTHNGKGDFSQERFDINTNTTVDKVSLVYDGVEYLSNKTLNADVTMTISDNISRFTFKENHVAINEFGINFDGYLSLGKDGSMDMDLSYEAKQATFKSLLSLVPSIYNKNFSGLEAVGNLAFIGKVKGRYDYLTMPAFNFGLKVDQGRITHPELSTSISNINLNLLIDNQDGVFANTRIDLKQLHMDFGNSPIDAKVLLSNLGRDDLDASIKGTLNLADISSLFPIQNISTKGNLNIDVKAQGTYDKHKGQMPKIDAVMELVNGQIASTRFPYALDKLNLSAKINNPTGKMTDFGAVIQDVSMEVDGEPVVAAFELANLNNYTWKFDISGGLDLDKIIKIFPVEGHILRGRVNTNLTTMGNMADLEAKRYKLLTTSGDLSVNNFSYSGEALQLPITISAMTASFNPKAISIERYQGTIGKSDLGITGSVSNYMEYLFTENQALKGTLNLTSKLIDLDEFKSQEEVVTQTPEKNYGVVEIPKNIDFLIKSNVQTMALMELTIDDTQGDILIKDGVAKLSGLNFNLLGGAFAANGVYDPRDLTKPQYNFKLSVDHLSANKAFDALKVVQTYFPIASNIDGEISTDVNVNGTLDQTMLPEMQTISGLGSINISNATLKNSNVVKGIGTLIGNTLLSNEQVAIKDLLMSFTIEKGLVKLKPFNLNLGDYQSSLSGTSSINGALDLDLKISVPARNLGSQLHSLVSQYHGGSASSDTLIIPLNIAIGGTVDEPTFKLKGAPKVADIIKNAIQEQTKEKTGIDLNIEREQQRQSILIEAESQAKKIIDEAKNLADKVRARGDIQAEKLLKDASNNPLKKIIVEEASKKIKKEADDAANKIEKEGIVQAKALLVKAQEEADALK